MDTDLTLSTSTGTWPLGRQGARLQGVGSMCPEGRALEPGHAVSWEV